MDTDWPRWTPLSGGSGATADLIVLPKRWSRSAVLGRMRRSRSPGATTTWDSGLSDPGLHPAHRRPISQLRAGHSENVKVVTADRQASQPSADGHRGQRPDPPIRWPLPPAPANSRSRHRTRGGAGRAGGDLRGRWREIGFNAAYLLEVLKYIPPRGQTFKAPERRPPPSRWAGMIPPVSRW